MFISLLNPHRGVRGIAAHSITPVRFTWSVNRLHSTIGANGICAKGIRPEAYA